MWEQFWHDAVCSLGPGYFCLAIFFVVMTVIRRRLHAQRKLRATYMLSDGGLNSVRVTLDVQFIAAELRRILSAYDAVLAGYAPVFNPNSALEVRLIF